MVLHLLNASNLVQLNLYRYIFIGNNKCVNEIDNVIVSIHVPTRGLCASASYARVRFVVNNSMHNI